MKVEVMNLWEETPGKHLEIPQITSYVPDNKTSDAAIVILPGGGYEMRAEHEGKDYAEFFCKNGTTAFVVDYRVSPHEFPLPLLDSRRAVKYVRYFSGKFGIDKNKIAIMGSSAGGHLAALTSTYYENTEYDTCDEIDKEDFVPDVQILCYPVIKLLGKGISHLGSGKNLLGERHVEMGEELSPDLIATEKTPPAFIWHTAEDQAVNVINSLDYAKRLKNVGVGVEMHIFPDGAHGLGLAGDADKIRKHDSQWSSLMLNWLKYIGF